MARIDAEDAPRAPAADQRTGDKILTLPRRGPTPDLPAPAGSPGPILGAQAWFDVPTRVVLLTMAGVYLSPGFDPAMDAALTVLLIVYGAVLAFSLLQLLPRVQALRVGEPGGPPAGTAESGLLNFLVDAAFVLGIAVIGNHDSTLVLPFMVTIAGARFFAWLPDRPVRPLILPFVLPFLILALRGADGLGNLPLGRDLLTQTLLMFCLLCIVYPLTRRMDPSLALVGRLTSALVGRDRRLTEAHLRAVDDAKRLEEQILRLAVLQDGIAAMNSAIALEDLMQMVVSNAVRVLKAEQSSIGLLDEATGELVIQAATGAKATALRRRRFAAGVGIAGWVIQHGKPLMVDDVRLDARYVPADNEDPVGPGTRSMICVPLRVERHVIGALSVTHSQPGALTTDDQRLLMSFAEQAALVVYKTRLLEERTRQSEELRRRGELIASLMSISQAVLSSLDLPQVLHTTITRISELIPFDDGRIYMVDPRTGMLESAVGQGGRAAMQSWEWARHIGPGVTDDGLQCSLAIPLAIRGSSLGCILLARAASKPFTPLETDAADQLARAATIAIDNALLFSSLGQQQQRATALYQLMLRVSDARNQRELAGVICQEIQQLAGASGAILLVHDTEQGSFLGYAASGVGADDPAVRDLMLPAHGDPFVSNILTTLRQRESSELLIFPDVPVQARGRFGHGACITVPLTISKRIYGLLLLESDLDPPIPESSKETINLAVSHCAVALERAELFEQTVAAARQAAMLHRVATEVQASLDLATVAQTTASGSLAALPIDSCEVYLFDAEHTYLERAAQAATAEVKMTPGWVGPECIFLDDQPAILQVLHSTGLVTGDAGPALPPAAGPAPNVVLGRLMGSEGTLGMVRVTTRLPAEEFIRRHATFCRNLWIHSGGALERSALYSTKAEQARMLHRRAQQLTDILNLSRPSVADVPLTTLLPQMAVAIAGSLGLANVEIQAIIPDAPAADRTAGGGPGVSLSALQALLEAGRAPHFGFQGVYLDAALLGPLVRTPPAQCAATPAGVWILMPLTTKSGQILGYLVADPSPQPDSPNQATEHEMLDVLSIFAQRLALILENHLVYEQVLTSKRKIESVVKSIGDGVIVTDAELNVLITNTLADRLLGTELSASTGRPVHCFIANPALLTQLEDCLATGQSSSADVDLVLDRAQLTYQAVVHSITALDQEMSSLGVVLTLRDVTLERAAERAKSDFLSIVSHELRTPLNSVMGFLDIILMGKTGPLNELQADFLGTAKQESVALQRLIDDLLDYTQVHSRMLRLELVPMDLSASLARVVHHAIPRLTTDELTLVNTVPPQVLVVGDEVRLEQIFKNLLDNAAKFTDGGGEIRFNLTLAEEYVTVEVRDTGCGIPPPQVGKIFDRFFQAENNSNRRNRGLGLGLAICKDIIEAHGGRIWVESELGVGTSVFVELQRFQPSDDVYDR